MSLVKKKGVTIRNKPLKTDAFKCLHCECSNLMSRSEYISHMERYHHSDTESKVDSGYESSETLPDAPVSVHITPEILAEAWQHSPDVETSSPGAETSSPDVLSDCPQCYKRVRLSSMRHHLIFCSYKPFVNSKVSGNISLKLIKSKNPYFLRTTEINLGLVPFSRSSKKFTQITDKTYELVYQNFDSCLEYKVKLNMGRRLSTFEFKTIPRQKRSLISIPNSLSKDIISFTVIIKKKA